MIRKHRLGGIRFGVLVSGCVGLACAGKQTPTGPVVGEVKIAGTSAVSESAIKKKILTTETGWWPFATEHYFDPVEWQTDLRRIERLYESRGYYEAEVVASEIKEVGKDEVEVIAHVDEKQPVRIGEIRIAGLESLTEQERALVLDELPTVKDGIFREGDWEGTKGLVVQRLRNLGHARATLAAEALVDVESDKARLTLLAHPGPRYRFSDIEVRVTPEGSGIEPRWVHEQVRLAIAEGRVYSDELLDEAEKRIFAMGVFSTVRVTAAEPDPASGRMPVLVVVREGPVHTLRLGGGVGFDQIRQEGRVISEWTNRNWMGGLRRLSLRALAGWAFLPSALAVARNQPLKGATHGPIYRTGADFEQPRFLERPSLRLKTTLESERTIEQTYNAIGGRAMGGVSWEPHSTLTIFPAYNIQGYWLNGPKDAPVASAPLALGCSSDPCFVVLSYLEELITWDTRDSPLSPRRGHYLSLSLQQGGGPLGGDFDYLRILPEARGYLTAGEDDILTLAARLRVGTLITRSGRPEDSAVTTRLYSGGSMWMRGFAMRRLSPMLLVPTPGAEGNEEEKIALPIGGNGLIEGSLEARGRVSESLIIAAFSDFGVVTRNRLPIGDIPNLQWAGGIGLRYLTPVGPLRIDLAFRLPFGKPPPLYHLNGHEITYAKNRQERRPEHPLDKPPPLMDDGTIAGSETGANINNNCFGIGGSKDVWVRDGLCAFHISIGEAF
jgi:translocation and assembly module TamA